MAGAAQSKELKAAFAKHERETRGQVKRLQRVFKILGEPARGKTCAAINGITEEGAEIMKDFKGMRALDAGLLAAAQAVEHYEISRYGTLRTWALELDMSDAASLLEATRRGSFSNVMANNEATPFVTLISCLVREATMKLERSARTNSGCILSLYSKSLGLQLFSLGVSVLVPSPPIGAASRRVVS